MTRIPLLVGILLLSVICACKKEEQATAEQPTATIVITNPQPGQEIKGGTELAIQAQIKGDVNLHGYEVFIVDKQSLDTLFEMDNHTHAKELQVNEIWVDTLSQAADLEVFVKTELNHEGASVTKTVSFKSRP
ncbi:MAG: hypothetical protein JST70_17400 [Bacteroidetes bacterium]|nr:hypothetical protein [Bacteroidota bacterium]